MVAILCYYTLLFYLPPEVNQFTEHNYQIVHGTKGHMAVYGPGCHPQNSIRTGQYTKILTGCANKDK
jgi:hypothetical protein